MLPIRHLCLLGALLSALFLVTACAGNRPAPAPPDEIATWTGQPLEDSFINPDGLSLFGRYWLPAGEARAVVVVIHGTFMHSGVHDELGRYLAAKGYAVYGIDLQGWGRSDGSGPRGDVYNYDKYVTDVAMIIARMQTEFPGRPVFAFGENLGGLVALLGQVQRRVFFDGLILSSPAYKPNPTMLGVRFPALITNMGLSAVAWWGSQLEHWPLLSSNINLRTLVDDEDLEEQLIADPYVTHNWLPAHYLTAMIEANKFLAQRIEIINVPIFVLQGDKDHVIPMSSAEEIILRTLSRDKQLKVFKGVGHSVMLQRERYEALEAIGRWLDLRTEPR